MLPFYYEDENGEKQDDWIWDEIHADLAKPGLESTLRRAWVEAAAPAVEKERRRREEEGS